MEPSPLIKRTTNWKPRSRDFAFRGPRRQWDQCGKKRCCLVELSPKESGELIITFERKPLGEGINGKMRFEWRQRPSAWQTHICPDFNFMEIDSDDNVLDFYRDEFDRLVEFLDGGEYQVRAGRGMGPMSTFIWKVWTPESWKSPVSTKSARKT